MSNSDMENRQHTEDIQDIISRPPSWLMRWGTVIFLGIILMMGGISALLSYPDIVKTQLKISSPNSPKPVISKISGKIVSILVTENKLVDSGQVLAYIESTADHDEVLFLLAELKNLQLHIFSKNHTFSYLLNSPHNFHLGELQLSYQNFYQAYLAYKATVEEGVYLKKKRFLQKDLSDILLEKESLLAQKELYKKEYDLAQDEFKMQQKLYNENIIAQAEFRKQESALLTSARPLYQTTSALVVNKLSYASKEKEIMELDNQIREEQGKFMQALNSIISEMDEWKSKYVLCANPKGKLSFAGIIQKGQFINTDQEVFYIDPGNAEFMGEMTIPQYNMGKVKQGQKVLVKLKSYPYEEYGMITGTISYIADVPYKDSVFISRVNFNNNDKFSHLKKAIMLKNGMLADADIVTEDASLLHRLLNSFLKMVH
jgi:multidrug efflux pump subunit AcrA (membrane-fusion protein)